MKKNAKAITKWKFKKNAEVQSSSDFWYDLTDGGYIKPEKALDGEQLSKINEAVALVVSFRSALEDAGLLEVN